MDIILLLLPSVVKRIEGELRQERVPLVQNDFLKVSQDYQEHRSKIFDKLLFIVQDQIMKKTFTAIPLEKINYDDNEIQIPTQTLAEIAKQTCRVHTLLASAMPASQIQLLFTNILDMFSREIPVYYMDVTPETSIGKSRYVNVK